ncbi:MAG: glycosyltransferase [Candidatus Sericytochromatia bacterium]
MAKILLTTFGSHGDLHPYLGMAKILLKHGHKVYIATHFSYKQNIENVGAEFVKLVPDMQDLGAEETWAHKVNDPANGAEFIFRKLVMPYIRTNFENISKIAVECDLIISHFLTPFVDLIAQKYNIPYLSCILQPSTFLSSYNVPLLSAVPFTRKLNFLGPNFFNLFYKIITKVSESWFYELNEFKQELNLDTSIKNPVIRSFSKDGTLALFDKNFVFPQPDWPLQTFQVGFPFFDQDLDSELTEGTKNFLDKGSEPIVFTLGTAIILMNLPFFEIAYEAVKKSNNRAIFLVGKKDKPIADYILKDENIHVTAYEPFSKLFPKAKIISHQCGIGTTAQALLSGKPQLMVPFAFDQPDNARVSMENGVGLALNSKKITSNNIYNLIKELENNSNFTENALKFSQKMKETIFEDELIKAINLYV